LMEGRIWVESQFGLGSKFHFTAQFSRGAKPVACEHQEPRARLDDRRVLIVDDNEANRRILMAMMRHWKMLPSAVESGPAALGALHAASQAAAPYELILLDVMMPGMDGFEVLEHVRREPEIDRPVVLMLSSADAQGDIARCRSLGAAAYLIKPVKPSELLEAIMQALQIAGEQKHNGRIAAAQCPAAMTAGRPTLRALIAEDNSVNQLLAVRILNKAGYVTVVANNGQEAVDAVSREPFDLVLMDVQMPVLDGYQATRLIRQHEQGTERHIPIVAMTAHALMGDREKCLEVGMDGYVSKPIQKVAFFAAIAEAMARGPAAELDGAAAGTASAGVA
jgi:CheY-like chemotaxis protein